MQGRRAQGACGRRRARFSTRGSRRATEPRCSRLAVAPRGPALAWSRAIRGDHAPVRRGLSTGPTIRRMWKRRLLQIVRQMVPSSRVELVPLAESQHHDETSGAGDAAESGSESGANESTLEIPLRCGASIYARLRIRPRAGVKSSLPHRRCEASVDNRDDGGVRDGGHGAFHGMASHQRG